MSIYARAKTRTENPYHILHLLERKISYGADQRRKDSKPETSCTMTYFARE